MLVRLISVRIVGAYVFADFYLMHAFQNALLDHFYINYNNTHKLFTSIIPMLYISTTDGDIMRRLLVDMWVEGCDAHLSKVELRVLWPEFFVDCFLLCKRQGYLLDVERTGDTFPLSFCKKYHRHDSKVSA